MQLDSLESATAAAIIAHRIPASDEQTPAIRGPCYACDSIGWRLEVDVSLLVSMILRV